MHYQNITPATFIRRPNRFIAEVLVDGAVEVVHVKNTGRCSVLVPGCRVWLTSPSSALSSAVAAGVKVLFLSCSVTPDGLSIVDPGVMW